MRFASPLFLLLLLLIPLLIWYFVEKRRKSRVSIRFSSISLLKELRGNRWGAKRDVLLTALRLIALALLIIAFARPQAGVIGREIQTQGISIMLCLDTSTSMTAPDFGSKNRFEAARESAMEFIKARSADQIGVVVFSAVAFTQCPLTLDHHALLDFLKRSQIGMTQTDGTAIGMAIATAVGRLKDIETKSKVIILLTDGRNNMGSVDPETAAKMAESLGIKIYTIGAGSTRPSMVMTSQGPVQIEELDEPTLKKIAGLTGGKYFRVADEKGLQEAFSEIDKMEKTELKKEDYSLYRDLYQYPAVLALLLILSEIILGNTILRKLP